MSDRVITEKENTSKIGIVL